MLYRVYLQTGSAKLYTEPRSWSRLPYRTAKEMLDLYPDDNFAVIGEIGGFVRPRNCRNLLLTGDGRALPILPRGSLKRPFEVGIRICRCGQKYLSCGNQGRDSRISVAPDRQNAGA